VTTVAPGHHPVITGLGIVSPIGTGTEAFWSSALAGCSGIDWSSDPEVSELPHPCRIVARVRDFHPNDWMGGMHGRMAGRFSHFAVAATRMALDDSGLKSDSIESAHIKVAFGSSICGLADLHESSFTSFLRGGKILPWTMLEFPVHAATSHVGAEAGALGQPTSFATACCAGLDAIGWAADQIRGGSARVVLASASDAPLSPHTLMTFYAARTLSEWRGPPAEASRPFDLKRSGLVLGEGAATLIIEDEEYADARGAKRYATILGFGSASEGGELRTVDESGGFAARAMTMAIREAGLEPSAIDYVCAHGNSMVSYDAAETAALKRVFGDAARNTPVSSIKSMCGHALGAAGAMQALTGCLVLRDGIAPPTINYRYPDPSCDLDYIPNAARRIRARHVLIHSHSIGGTHLAMVLGKPL
jgi:3-oxoacyl-[acyl-carrier-protein] synthase II